MNFDEFKEMFSPKPNSLASGSGPETPMTNLNDFRRMLTTPVAGNSVEDESPFDQHSTIPKSWMKQSDRPTMNISDKDILSIAQNIVDAETRIEEQVQEIKSAGTTSQTDGSRAESLLPADEAAGAETQDVHPERRVEEEFEEPPGLETPCLNEGRNCRCKMVTPQRKVNEPNTKTKLEKTLRIFLNTLEREFRAAWNDGKYIEMWLRRIPKPLREDTPIRINLD